jgi:hypothetical protein
MKTTALNLLISDKPDEERDSVAESFASVVALCIESVAFGILRPSNRRRCACMAQTHSVSCYSE